MKHENVVLFDNAGLPSIMVKFTPEAGKPLDPVFVVCGRRAKAFRVLSPTQRRRTVLVLTPQADFAGKRAAAGI